MEQQNYKTTSNQHINIIDRPCGTGKTTELLKSFDIDKKYLVVVPLLTEVERVMQDACVSFVQPTSEYLFNKTDSLRDLLISGENIVTTHSMYSRITLMARDGLLDDYHLIIDEVPEVVKSGTDIKSKSYKDIYIEGGFIAEDGDTGKVTPTQKWTDCLEDTNDTLSKRLYEEASSGCLYNVNDVFLLWALPIEVLTKNKSLTIYTYLAKGSMLLAYLDKLNVKYHHDINTKLDLEFRRKAKSLITVETIPAIEKMNLSTTGQSKMGKDNKDKVATALKNLRGRGGLNGVPIDNIIITSLKSNWFYKGINNGKTIKPSGFSKGSGVFKANWLSNTTRGTNNYVHTTHMVYLWDQHINDYLRRWLNMGNGRFEANNNYAITELVQWVYRSQVRKGLPITLYLPSSRMRGLLESWLNAEDFK